MHRAKDSVIQAVPLQQLVSILVERLVRMHVVDLVRRVWLLVLSTRALHRNHISVELKIRDRIINIHFNSWIRDQLCSSL